MKCEYCGKGHDGSYGSGRFCNSKCARGFSTQLKRKEINAKVSIKMKKKPLQKICLYCNKTFETYSKKKICCNNFCANHYRSLKKCWKDEDFIKNFGFLPKTKLYDIISWGYHLG